MPFPLESRGYFLGSLVSSNLGKHVALMFFSPLFSLRLKLNDKPSPRLQKFAALGIILFVESMSIVELYLSNT
jgi:hypothetical protein